MSSDIVVEQDYLALGGWTGALWYVPTDHFKDASIILRAKWLVARAYHRHLQPVAWKVGPDAWIGMGGNPDYVTPAIEFLGLPVSVTSFVGPSSMALLVGPHGD
jgi:hypothetical protein